MYGNIRTGLTYVQEGMQQTKLTVYVAILVEIICVFLRFGKSCVRVISRNVLV
jgi:hypothetical protein